MTPAQVLNDAATYLETHGWRQHDVGEHGSPCCVLGAIAEAAGQGDTSNMHYLAASRALHEVVGGNTSVIAWNDAPGRTVEEVTAALRSAAQTATEEEDV